LLTEDAPGTLPPLASGEATRHARRTLWGACAALLAGYLVYSQTVAFHWDEGFHLLAARLINAGKTPYIDFIFPQAPLNAYWNALWMRVFGENWRVPHVAASLLAVVAFALAARFILDRFPDARWRFPGAIATLLLFGLNFLVVQYAPIAQSYAFSMCMMSAAFLTSTAAVERRGLGMAAIAGFFAGAAVCSTMLAAAAGPVFLLWILVYNQTGSRISKFLGFALGSGLAFSPIIRLLIRAPQQTWFNLVQYHVIYRRVEWPGATVHDIDVLTSWIGRSQGLIIVVLILAAIFFLWDREWERKDRAPFYLCIGIVIAVGLQNGVAHPTFPQYFLPMAPALAILSVLGLYATAQRLAMLHRPGKLIAVLGVIFLLGALRGVFDDRDDFTWPKVEKSARKVELVTPKEAPLMASEPIYFLTRRPIPEGMEFAFAHKLDLGKQRNSLLHIVPRAELERRISAGQYPTDAVCDDNDEVDRVDNLDIYQQKADMGECTIFWQFSSTPKTPSLKAPAPKFDKTAPGK
jgi:4-amino-4-deoxy-L-arabinose transferase-like glycosyltransferase